MSIKGYYQDSKKKGVPHCSDEVGADVVEASGLKTTRQTKKRKFEKIHFEPKSITDYT